MVRRTIHGIETCQDCLDIWLFVREAESIRFNALLRLCKQRKDPKYSAPKLQRHLEGMVGKFLKRTKKSSQEVVYSLVDAHRFYMEPINVSILAEGKGRELGLGEIVQLLIDHFEWTIYSDLEITIKEFLKEETPSEEERAIARTQGRLLVSFCKDAMAGRQESEYREVLKTLKERAKTEVSTQLSPKKENQGSQ
jgi:hypothetical protein